MSDDPPPAREIAAARRPAGRAWARGRRPLLIAGGAVALLWATWLLMPAREKPVEAYKSQAKPGHADYVGPTPVVAKADVTITPEQRTKIIERLTEAKKEEAPPPHKPVMMSYGSGAQLPEYMKPKAAPATAAEATRSSIAYKPVAFEGSRAVTIPDRNLVLLPGPISCVMDTMIITVQTSDSPFQCHLDHDVLSPTNVTLMEAGTQVQGSYKSVVQGEERVIAVTANAITPNGVMVQLGGPVADQLGAAGVPGSVDSHFWKKFGPAMLLSLLDAGTQVGTSALQSGGSINIGSGMQGGAFSQLTHSLLEQQMKVPPTISVNQGARVMLWVTKPISFGDSYKLEPR